MDSEKTIQTDAKGVTHIHQSTDWSSGILILVLFALVVLCAGDPDLLDAITQRVSAACTP